MASLNSTVTITTTEYRPCLVDGKRALFHRWADDARPLTARGILVTTETPRHQGWSVQGIVEYENGTVARVWPSSIRFLDTERFEQYDWSVKR